jgi:hypothetical protein
LGSSAQTIAFLKRESYAVLDLKAEQDLDKILDLSVSSQIQPGSSMMVDLGSQLQVVNLGYLGQESNIFELASTYVDFSFLPLFQDFKNKSAGSNAGALATDANQ